MLRPRLQRMLAALAIASIAGTVSASDEEFFETKIRPLLANRCFECHGVEKQQGEVRLDTKAAAFSEAPGGMIIVSAKPAESRLVQVIAYDPYDTQMPPAGKLPAEEIALLTEWVKRGAVWPDSPTPSTPDAAGQPAASAGQAEHWAFQPVTRQVPPDVKTPALAVSPVDRFILAELEKHELSFSPPADDRTFLRRLYFDLVGIPPTPEEVAAFESDGSPDAAAKVVDRLLSSPLYGQRWGRHWLDVARYADTKGYVFTEDIRYPYAYTYRDYVVNAFNADTPFDQFILEQLAADKLDLPDSSPKLAALGFLTVGRRNQNNRQDILDDRIDVTTRGFLGLTVSCARCHDHKFDPIPTADYYSLYGVFDSCDDPEAKDLPLIGSAEKSAEYERFQKELERRQAELAAYVAEQKNLVTAEMRRKASDYLLAVVQGNESEDGLRRRGVAYWKEMLGRVSADDPVWGPWKRLSTLPADDFAAQAKTAVEAMRQGAPFQDGLGAFVLERLSSQPLASVGDLAKAYGVLLTGTVERPEGVTPEQSASFDALAAKLTEAGTPFVLNDEQARQLFDRAQRNEERERQKKIDAFRANSEVAPPRAMVLQDRAVPVEPVIFIRGNAGRRGDKVPRQFLELLSEEERQPFAKDASGRLDLARAIADPANPLTARVIVNRVWQHHFGEGLVRTPSDFGSRAEPPTHPALLDWLSAEFVESGWSVKDLHRTILLSTVYRQSSRDRSVDDPRLAELDPTNRLLWRMIPRRLDFESMRDATLAVAGRLDPALDGRPIELFETNSPRRTIYGYVNRNDLPGVWRSFDFPSPDASIAERPETTVPQQALFGMNSPFIIGQAKALAARPEVSSATDPNAKVAALYGLALQRKPNEAELQAAGSYLAGDPMAGSELNRTEQLAQVLLLTNEFLFID
ncbi:MAG: PSD1 and planctomycete cytochrome C domain-containing protein [Planctomycetaceae bacterium]